MRTITDKWAKGTLTKPRQMAYRALIDQGAIRLHGPVTVYAGSLQVEVSYDTEMEQTDLTASLRREAHRWEEKQHASL